MMPERRRNQFERKCGVCGTFGIPTPDGRVMHYGRIATCREHPVVEGDVNGAQITVDGLVPTATTIHTNGDVQGTHGESGRRDSGESPSIDAYWEAMAKGPTPFA